MNIHERIKYRRKELGLSADEVAEAIGVSRATYYRYESEEIEKMPTTVLEPLSIILRTSPQYLMGWNDVNPSVKDRILEKFKLYDSPISAGRGLWLDEGCEYSYQEIENPQINADFALKVRGDSMSPMYNDGDVVFVKSKTLIEPGQIGVFLINGEGYLKQWQGNRLISINNSYDPIYINEDDEFVLIGKVVSKLENFEQETI